MRAFLIRSTYAYKISFLSLVTTLKPTELVIQYVHSYHKCAVESTLSPDQVTDFISFGSLEALTCKLPLPTHSHRMRQSSTDDNHTIGFFLNIKIKFLKMLASYRVQLLCTCALYICTFCLHMSWPLENCFNEKWMYLIWLSSQMCSLFAEKKISKFDTILNCFKFLCFSQLT